MNDPPKKQNNFFASILKTVSLFFFKKQYLNVTECSQEKKENTLEVPKHFHYLHGQLLIWSQ